MKKTIIYSMGNIENIPKQDQHLKVPSKKKWYLVNRNIYEENIYEKGNWSNKERKNELNWHIGYIYGIRGYKNIKIVNIKIKFRCYKCKSMLSEKQISENNKKLKESDIPIICRKCNIRMN